jgi:hypothetical protein
MQVRGAAEAQLRAAIEKHRANAVASFGGSGMSVGGGGAAAPASAAAMREARLRALGGAGSSSGGSSNGGANGGAAHAAPAAPAPAAPKPAPAPAAPAPAPAAPAPVPAAAPAPPSASAPSVRPVGAEALALLESMGFPRARGIRALALGGGGTNVEAAIAWLEAHQDEPGLDEPLPGAAPEDAPASGADGGGGAPAGGAGSGGGEFTAEEEAAAQLEADSASAASGAGAQKLSREEMLARIKAMRATKAAAAKEEARLREMRRREDGQKAAEQAELIRTNALRLEEEKRKREKERAERELLRQRLEAVKDKAERESRQKGAVSEETAARVKELQAMWDGAPLAPKAPEDPLVTMKKFVAALTAQKTEGIGLTAAQTVATLSKRIADAPADPKLRTLPWVAGKAAFGRIAPARAGLALMLAIGWRKEDGAAAEDCTLRMPDEAVRVELLRATAAEVEAAVRDGKFER